MQSSLVLTGGIVALGLGAAAGIALPPTDISLPQGGEGDTLEAKTLSRADLAKLPSGNTTQNRFGVFDHETFASAQDRLDLLLLKLEKTGPYGDYSSPLRKARLLEEIETIFDLANESELIAFLENDLTDLSGRQIVSLAFSALASHDPQRAAELHRDLGTPTGLLEVLRVWIDRDPAAARRWIDEIANEEARKSAEQTYLGLILVEDPAKALTILPQIDSEKGNEVIAILGETAALEQLPSIAETLFESESGDGPSPLFQNFFPSWAGREPDAALDWFLTRDLDTADGETIYNSLVSLATEEPTLLLDRITPLLADEPSLERAAGQAWWSWLTSKNGETDAITWLGENGSLAGEFGNYAIADRAVREEDWTPERTDRVLAALTSLPKNAGTDAFAQGFVERLSRYEPEVALRYALDILPLGSESGSTLARAIGSWAKEEPAEAVRWTLEKFPTEDGKYDALRFALGNWAEKDGPAAADYSTTLPEKYRSSAQRGIGYAWAQRDPDGVIKFLKQVKDPESVSSLTRGAFREIAENQNASGYLSEALKMPPGRHRYESIRGLFGGWALSNADDAMEAVDEVPEGWLRDGAITGFNEYSVRRDPEATLTLASRMSKPEARDRELVSRGRSWLRRDEAAARKWIENAAMISAEVRKKIFQ